MDLKNLCKEIVHIASDTGFYIRNESENFDIARVENKGLHDFVSYVDKGAEKRLITKLGLLLPEAGFYAEEGTTVACGRFDAFFEYGLKPWDVSAGMLLVREASGKVSDFSGNEEDISGIEIVASNGNLFPEIINIISNFMQE